MEIVRIDPYEVKPKLKDMVTEVISVIEIKYDFSAADSTIATIESDVEKIKDYLDFGMGGRCYFACIYENEPDDTIPDSNIEPLTEVTGNPFI